MRSPKAQSAIPHSTTGSPAMKEWVGVRQIPGESKRRWFSSPEFDLIVWLSPDGEFTGFELCYDKPGKERSLIWNRSSGFRHMMVDDGEQRPGRHKAAPILVPDDVFDAQRVYLAFLEASRSLPKEVADFVLQAIEQYPEIANPPYRSRSDNT